MSATKNDLNQCLICRSGRRGLTLAEVLGVIGIIGVLAALSIPAVQASRESARNSLCKNNLRQVLLATQEFHTIEKSLPSLYVGTSLEFPLAEWDLFHMHSWRVPLLKHLENEQLHDKIDFAQLATAPDNLSVAQSVVPFYLCPTGSDPKSTMGWGLKHESIGVSQPPAARYRYQVVRSDYDAMAGIKVLPSPFPENADPESRRFIRWGVWGWPEFENQRISGSRLQSYREGRFRDVVDGLSNTIAVVERGGKPIEMVRGKPNATADNPQADYPGQVGWSVSNNFHWAINGPGIGVNQTNSRGIYSLHPGGANVAMADGSVRFLSDSTEFNELVRLFSRFDE